MKKQGNPRPRHLHRKHPLPFFLSSTLSVLPLVILEPTSPYISWDTFILYIQQFQSGEAKVYFLSVFDSDIFISVSKTELNKDKKYMIYCRIR